LIQWMKPSQYPTHARFVAKILAEHGATLYEPYIRSLSKPLEPSLTLQWVQKMAWMQKVIQLGIEQFGVVFPPALTSNALTHMLLSEHPLIQWMGCRCILAGLLKLERVLENSPP